MLTVDGYIQSLHAALGTQQSVIARSESVPNSSEATPRAVPFTAADIAAESDRATARQLAAALDRAIDLGQFELADRIAHQSMRLSREHPLLAERLARLRAFRGEFDIALAILDACRARSNSMRLLRIVCLLHVGRRHEAHADLVHWSRKASAPLQARLILGLLECEAGATDDAAATLQRNLQQIEDPATLAALMLMTGAQGRSNMAAIWAQRLGRAAATHPRASLFEVMLVASGHGRLEQHVTTNPQTIATLATELVAAEHLLPALCEAQRLGPEIVTARLVCSAIERGMEDFQDQRNALLALANLHDIIGERELATAWRQRAAAAEPRWREDVLASIAGDRIERREDATASSIWLEHAA